MEQRGFGVGGGDQLGKEARGPHDQIADVRRFGQILTAVVFGGVGYGGVANPGFAGVVVVVRPVDGVTVEVVTQRIGQIQPNNQAPKFALVVLKGGDGGGDLCDGHICFFLLWVLLIWFPY